MPKVVPEYKEAAKERIVKAAFKVFTKKGYHQSTMDMIAKEMGVSKGALYQYFKNKKEVLNEIVLSYHMMFREVLRASFEKKDNSSIAEEGSESLLEKYRLHHEMFFEIIAIAGHDEEIKESLRNEYEKNISLISSFFLKQQQNGKIPLGLGANTLAQLYIALYVGMAMKVIMGDDSIEIHRVWSKAISSMMSSSTSKTSV
jgi:AcrR family transcriptional regulator